MHSADSKKIAFLCHPYHRGGVTRWMADAAIAFAQKGYDTYFLTLEPKQPFFSGKGRETMLQLLGKETADIHIISTKVGYTFEFGTPEYRAYCYKCLLNNLPVGTPVIVSDDGMTWAATAALHSSFPLIGVLHSDFAYYYDLATKYQEQISVLACVSERVKNTLLQKLPPQPIPGVYTIPCGIPLLPPDFNTVTNKVLELIYVGRITNEAKRPGDLVKISALLLKENVKFHLNIIGDGEEKIPLEQKVAEEGLTEYVTFRGWRTEQEIRSYMLRADILLLTSDFEGLPLVMMEALACGCGFTGTRVSGIEDYENVSGAASCFMVYNVGDIAEAVQKIRKITDVPTKIRQKTAREIAENNFSMKVCLQKYEMAIDNIPARSYSKQEVRISTGKRIYSQLIAFARFMKVKATRKS